MCSSFGCHVADSDMAPGIHVRQIGGFGQTWDRGALTMVIKYMMTNDKCHSSSLCRCLSVVVCHITDGDVGPASCVNKERRGEGDTLCSPGPCLSVIIVCGHCLAVVC